MSPRYRGVVFLVAVLTAAAAASAAPPAAPVRVERATAPATTDARVRAALREAVRRELAEADLGATLRDYTVSPSLIQMRRYVESDTRQLKLVCIVSLSLRDDQGALLASVNGNATTINATQRDTLDAAAHAAVVRLPEALRAALRARQHDSEVAQR